MLRKVLGTLAGLLAWIVIVTVLNFGLRAALPGYAAVEKAMAFTLVMMVGRLAISFVSSLASGFIATKVGDHSSALIAGVILLILFVPVHYQNRSKFPVWYHLSFLASLPLLSIAGSRLARR